MIRPTKTKNGITLCVRYLAVYILGIQLMGCGALMKHYASVPDENTPGARLSGGVVGKDIIAFSWLDLDLSIQVQNHLYSGFSMLSLVVVPIIPLWEKEGEVQEGSYLLVWVDIVPKDNTFSFDPGRAILKFDDGTNVQVKEFVGPFKPWFSPRAVVRGCGERRYSLGVATSRSVVVEEDIKTPHGSIPIPFEKSFNWLALNPLALPASIIASIVTIVTMDFSSFSSWWWNLEHSCFLLGFDTKSSPDRTFVLSIEGIYKSEAQYPVPEIRFRKGSIWNLFPVP